MPTTKIKIIKSMAKRRIESHLYEGQRLTERLTLFFDTALGGDASAYATLSKLKAEHTSWSQNVASDLSKMFNDKSLANDFRDMSLIPFDENDSHLEEKNRDSVNRQMIWLASLAARIDEFPQAHNTPVTSHGRSF